MSKRLTKEEYRKKFENSNDGLELLSDYISRKDKVYVRCKKCKYEWWVDPSNVLRKSKNNGCPCCGNQIVVYGKNDITTVAPWMIPYFQGGYDEAKQYTPGSETRIIPKCPDCGRLLKENYIYNIYHHKSSCICGDGWSYPNKFSYCLFMSILNQLDYYEHEYSPKWAGLYSYDNYFIKDNVQYILEMDGGLGHGKKSYGSKDIDISGYLRDKEKDKMAIQNNIILIRVDVDECNITDIKNKTYDALKDIIDLDNVDWNEIIRESCSSMIKKVCNFYEHINDNLDNIAETFKISKTTVIRYLQLGTEIEFCCYKTVKDKRNQKMLTACRYKRENIDLTSTEISMLMGCSKSSVIEYLKEGNLKGLCIYNPKDEMKRVHKKEYGMVV